MDADKYLITHRGEGSDTVAISAAPTYSAPVRLSAPLLIEATSILQQLRNQ
jgi:hypothetical protein